MASKATRRESGSRAAATSLSTMARMHARRRGEEAGDLGSREQLGRCAAAAQRAVPSTRWCTASTVCRGRGRPASRLRSSVPRLATSEAAAQEAVRRRTKTSGSGSRCWVTRSRMPCWWAAGGW